MSAYDAGYYNGRRSLGPEIVSLRRALRDARERSALEAAVIDAAVAHRQNHSDACRCPFCVTVDALLAARGKP